MDIFIHILHVVGLGILAGSVAWFIVYFIFLIDPREDIDESEQRQYASKMATYAYCMIFIAVFLMIL